MVCISLEQIESSLEKLASVHPFFGTTFLAFKRAVLPIEDTITLNFTQVNEDILIKYYKLGESFGFYSPFKTSDVSNRWQRPRYASTTLQRIAKDTFSDALLHPTKRDWGWRQNYVEQLCGHLDQEPIPAFDLAVWLYRFQSFVGSVQPYDLIDRLFEDFYINEDEKEQLFSLKIELVENWLSEECVDEEVLLDVLGRPEGSEPQRGAALAELVLNEIGPADHFIYTPADRLNIITGDNSLGKTFLLEAIWWSLTGEWSENHLKPRDNVSKETPYISYKVNIRGREKGEVSKYDWSTRKWKQSKSRLSKPGLTVYAKSNGSFVIWDPARVSLDLATNEDASTQIVLSADDIWYGLRSSDGKSWVCNGIIRDWVTWQIGGDRYRERWIIFKSVLKTLSPLGERMEVGEPQKEVASDAEIPTLRLPYGDVAVTDSSAGVKRAIALAYCLVWSWYRHLDLSSVTRNEPERRIILLLDEAEAHLHPKWQRTIIPSVMQVMKDLFAQATPQLHIATHSPLVMASVEPLFDYKTDNLYHMRLDHYKVVLEELNFVKRGRADLWLMSDVFGLGHARSVEAEKAIEEAKGLQMARRIDESRVLEVNEILTRLLAPDDDFWPRWRGFALRYGLKK